MSYITIVGIMAAVFTSAAGLPQIIKTYKTKSAKDVSMVMIWQILLGTTLWMIYGFFKRDAAIILAQAVAYLFYIFLLVIKIKYNHLYANQNSH